MEETNNNINNINDNGQVSQEDYKIEVVGSAGGPESGDGNTEEATQPGPGSHDTAEGDTAEKDSAEGNSAEGNSAEEAAEEVGAEAHAPGEPTAGVPNEDKGHPQESSTLGKIGTLLGSLNQLARTLIVLAVVAVVVWGFFSIRQRARHKKVVRSITQTVIEVKKIKEFCTANYYEETVVTATRKRLMKSEDLAIIVKGTVRVGFDLSHMNTRLTSDTSIVIDLPAPIVLDVITNPSDFETFQEDGHWDHKQVTTYKNMARAMILHHAKADGIMQDAEENGVAKLTLLFKRMGMKQVTVNVVQPEPTSTESGVPYVGGAFKIPEKQDPAI